MVDFIVIYFSFLGKKFKFYLLYCNVFFKYCDIYLGFKLFFFWRFFLWKKGVIVIYVVEVFRSNYLSLYFVFIFKGEVFKVVIWKVGFFLV